MLSQEAVKEFQRIYKKVFKEDLPDEEALERATKFLNLMKIVYKPIIQKQNDKETK
jgi:hypothetical protein